MRFSIGDVGIAMSPGPVRPVHGDIGFWRVRTLDSIRRGEASPGLVLVGRVSQTKHVLIGVEDVEWDGLDHYLAGPGRRVRRP